MKLKKCPFCKMKNLEIQKMKTHQFGNTQPPPTEYIFRIKCCGCGIRTSYFNDTNSLGEYWNDR